MLDKTNDSWTPLHDLALVYFAVAYGADYELTDAELSVVTGIIHGWQPDRPESATHELVLEAMAVLLNGDSRSEVIHSIESLKDALSDSDRERALEEIVRIASADGILLRSEHSLISVLAEIWALKLTGQRLLDGVEAAIEETSDWGILHDIGLVYLVVAHSTDNDLSTREIGAILSRMKDWQPDAEPEHLEDVLRSTLHRYAAGPDQDLLTRSVTSIRDRFPMAQRVVMLDDCVQLARLEGEMNETKEDIIAALSRAWKVNVRLDGMARA